MTFWFLIAFEEKVAISTSLEVSMPNVLQLQKSSSYEVAHGICVKNEVRLGFFQVSFKYEFISTIFCYICSFSAVFGQYLG